MQFRNHFLPLFLLIVVTLSGCGGGTSEELAEDSQPSEIQLNAWIGSTNTELTLPTTAQGLTLTSSTDRNCDLLNYSVCAMGQQNILVTSNLTDTAATLTQTAWYWLENENQTSQPLAITADQFPARTSHQVIAFNNQRWLIGGWNGRMSTNDIWSSVDGVHWIQQSANADFNPRFGHQTIVFNNKLWLIGGATIDGRQNDVWRSEDGNHWRQAFTGTLRFQSEQEQKAR